MALFCGMSAGATSSTKKTASKTSKSSHGKSSRHRRTRKGAWKKHGQQKIDAARATQIQQALIREKYLDGQPTGVWDSRTETAMQRYQTDHGWQSKVTPDSRALIKLGLGPSHESDLINQDTKINGSAVASTTTTTPNAPTKRQ